MKHGLVPDHYLPLLFNLHLFPLSLSNRDRMFNSPASNFTPKRGVTRPRDSLSVASRATPSLFSEARATAGLTPARPARLAALAQVPASPTSSVGETIRTIRESDGSNNITWAKDGYAEVYSAGGLPRELQAYLKRPEVNLRTASGHVDSVSGFAFVTFPDRCVAWNYQKVR